MTHAALKDLADEIERLALATKADGGTYLNIDKAFTWAGRLRALSAMEGEAHVEDMVESTDRVTITAPPPQQAEREREAFIRGYKHGACHYIGGDVTEELHEAACWAVDHQSPDAGVFPTPSPGPQGGGEAVRDEGFVKDLRFLIAYTIPHPIREFVISNLVDRGWLTDEHSKPCELTPSGRALVEAALATPPAHQPGEVVTDEMVERLARHCAGLESANFRTLEEAINHRNNWRRLIPEARAALTAALAPKEAGHG